MSADFEDYLGTEVFDQQRSHVGSLDCFWTNDDDQAVFLGIKLPSSAKRATVVPVTLATADERHSCIRIQSSGSQITSAPSLDCDEELDRDLVQRVYSHFHLSPGDEDARLHITRAPAH
jgi:hypothetical protein